MTPAPVSPKVLILDAPPLPGGTGGTAPGANAQRLPELTALRAAGIDAQVQLAENLSPSELDRAVAEASVILTWRSPAPGAMLERAAKCLLVQVCGPGNGPAKIDLATADRLGIYAASHPSYASGLWANATWSALLELARRAGLSERDLKRKRLGIAGLGETGRRLAAAAGGLKMRVWAFDPFCPPEHFAFSGAIACPSLEELLGTAQILILSLPLLSATQHMLQPQHLRLLAKGSFLINAGAAELIAPEAPAEALETGRLGGFACASAIDLERFSADGAQPAGTQPVVLNGFLNDPWPTEAAEQSRAQTGKLLADFFRGGRPPHLLIDPPCPRHALLMG